MAKIVSKGRNTWEDGTVMTYTITDNGILTISGVLKDWNSVYIRSKAPFHHIVIEEGITTIGNSKYGMFYHMENIEELTLPSSLISIGDKAFNECINLKRINFSDGLVSIGKEAFRCCERLERVVFPKTLKVIKEMAFGGCKSLETVTIPNGLHTIESNAFRFCKALQNINIPLSVKKRGREIFYGCESLEEVIQPDGNIIVGRHFIYTEPGGLEYFCQISNINPAKSWTVIKPDDPFEIDGEVVLPNYVERNGKKYKVDSIAEEAYYENEKLTSIVLPDSIKTIRSSAFMGCVNLVSVKNGQSLQTISTHAFDGCEKLETLEISDLLETIGLGAFDDCKKLQLIDIDDQGLKYIGSCLVGYDDKDSLRSSLIVREGTKGIGEEAFCGNTKLKEIILPNGLKEIGYIAFQGCSNLKHIKLPETLTHIGSEAFDETGITELIVPWKKTINIDYACFPEKTTVYIPKGCIEAYKNDNYWNVYNLIEK